MPKPRSSGSRLEGYDTNLRTSAAFSTLGWFDDPLLSHLLRYDKVVSERNRFSRVVSQHALRQRRRRIQRKLGQLCRPSRRHRFFSRERSGTTAPNIRRAVLAWEEEKEFGAFIEEVVAHVDGALRSGYVRATISCACARKCFARSKAEWARRIADRPQHRFRGFSQQPLNNAVLMHYVVYLKDLDLFESLYEASGRNLARTIERCAEAVGKRRRALRSGAPLVKRATRVRASDKAALAADDRRAKICGCALCAFKYGCSSIPTCFDCSPVPHVAF